MPDNVTYYPYLNIEIRNDSYHVAVHVADNKSRLREIPQTEDSLKTVVDELLDEYPNLFIRNVSGKRTGKHLHIFQVREGEERRRFVKTQEEVSNPFRNRRRYANAYPKATVSFDTLDI